MPGEERLFPLSRGLVREGSGPAPATARAMITVLSPRALPSHSSQKSSICDLRQPDEPPRPATVPVLATQGQVTKVRSRLEDAKGVFVRILGLTCEGMKPHKRYPITLKWGDTGEAKTVTLPSVDEKSAMTEADFLQSSHVALPMQPKRRLQVKVGLWDSRLR